MPSAVVIAVVSVHETNIVIDRCMIRLELTKSELTSCSNAFSIGDPDVVTFSAGIPAEIDCRNRSICEFVVQLMIGLSEINQTSERAQF